MHVVSNSKTDERLLRGTGEYFKNYSTLRTKQINLSRKKTIGKLWATKPYYRTYWNHSIRFRQKFWEFDGLGVTVGNWKVASKSKNSIAILFLYKKHWRTFMPQLKLTIWSFESPHHTYTILKSEGGLSGSLQDLHLTKFFFQNSNIVIDCQISGKNTYGKIKTKLMTVWSFLHFECSIQFMWGDRL